MGNQILIIAFTGTYNAKLAEEIATRLNKDGAQIRHAVLHYNQNARFAIGSPTELAAEMAAAGFATNIVQPDPDQNQPATLETIQAGIRSIDERLAKFVKYEKDGAPQGRKKKNTPTDVIEPEHAPEGTDAPEGTGAGSDTPSNG